MMNEKYTKLEALLADEEKMEKVFVEDVAQTLKNLAAEGIDMSEDELAQLANGVMAGLEAPAANDELNEEALENVAGGGPILYIIGHHHAVGGKKQSKVLSHFKSYKDGYANGKKMVGG